MTLMKIKLHDTAPELTIKNSFRGYIIYEQIMKQSFLEGNMTNLLVLFYSMYLAADINNANPLSLDEFIEWCDEHNDKFTEFIDWLGAISKQSGILNDDNKEDVPQEGDDQQKKE